MPLSKEHLKRNPAERKVGKHGQNKATAEAQFNRADMLLQEVCADIINGLTRNDIVMKFANKQYEYQKKAIGEAQAGNYIKMAYLIMAEDRVKEQDQLRDQLYSQYMMLYNDLVVTGNSLAAKQVLDSMSKIFLNEERKVDVNVNGADNKVSINFSFGNNDDGQL